MAPVVKVECQPISRPANRLVRKVRACSSDEPRCLDARAPTGRSASSLASPGTRMGPGMSRENESRDVQRPADFGRVVEAKYASTSSSTKGRRRSRSVSSVGHSDIVASLALHGRLMTVSVSVASAGNMGADPRRGPMKFESDCQHRPVRQWTGRMLGQAAEAAGFDSVWTVEHVVYPGGYESTYPCARRQDAGSGDNPIPDRWFGWPLSPPPRPNSACDRYLLLPERHPVTYAKEVATSTTSRVVACNSASASVGSRRSSRCSACRGSGRPAPRSTSR